MTLVLALSGIAGAVPKGGDARASEQSSVKPLRVTRPACADARRKLAYYKSATAAWSRKMGAGSPMASGRGTTNRPRSCPTILRAAKYWRAKAREWHRRYERWQRNSWHARIHRLYEKWRCIHEHEGAWNASNPPYHGGLQFDDTFQREYGPEFMRRWGGAEHWPVWAQLIAAERAYRGFRGWAARGFTPWPNTARMCGLL